ncbi:GTP cyclohydrolase FolE2 [Nonomuraea sp. NPDC049758]|uniref:GTP cyclohydrolase FolE2 n=1 Tax=Nonomuraea sp. NPDC049758 TaxID=3154360 RepID=UPI00341AA2D0
MLDDVQAHADSRGVDLDEVGIDGLQYPVLIADREGVKRETIATVKMSVALASTIKGAHLSRFVEIFHASRDQLSLVTVLSIADDLRRSMSSLSARVHLEFPYLVEKQAPVTRLRAYVAYQCAIEAESSATTPRLALRVQVPVTSVCPCSKAISDRGAHNQRGNITVYIEPTPPATDLWFDELIELAEEAASQPVYALLKRPDERHITMAAYDNPVFVEDMVRNVCVALNSWTNLIAYRVQAVNDESIHNHAAYAVTSRNMTSTGAS